MIKISLPSMKLVLSICLCIRREGKLLTKKGQTNKSHHKVEVI